MLCSAGGQLGIRDPLNIPWIILAGKKARLLRRDPLEAGSDSFPLDHSSWLMRHPCHAQMPTRKFSTVSLQIRDCLPSTEIKGFPDQASPKSDG